MPPVKPVRPSPNPPKICRGTSPIPLATPLNAEPIPVPKPPTEPPAEPKEVA